MLAPWPRSSSAKRVATISCAPPWAIALTAAMRPTSSTRPVNTLAVLSQGPRHDEQIRAELRSTGNPDPERPVHRRSGRHRGPRRRVLAEHLRREKEEELVPQALSQEGPVDSRASLDEDRGQTPPG